MFSLTKKASQLKVVDIICRMEIEGPDTNSLVPVSMKLRGVIEMVVLRH